MSARCPELDAMRALAREASRLVMQIYATDFAVEMKGEDDPVTRADKEANALICDALATAFPSHGIVAEESAPSTEAELRRLQATPRTFFVDPVDGTREFASKNGEFCVMIGLAEQGRALAGVIAVPVEDELFVGVVGEGAWRERLSGDGDDRTPLALREPADAGQAVAVVSRSHPSPRTRELLDELGVVRTKPCGSVGVKAARILQGAADLYVHPSTGAKLWDASAPDAIIRAAGGVLGDLDGRAIDYRGDLMVHRGLVATSPALFARLVAIVRGEAG
jgi:3'(2'), 5'-bisphosphate nucleotidase